jgi:nicotinate-nucleotide adenylyltransferase
LICKLFPEGVSLNRYRIGVFGGAFDPIHIGHLILAEEARYQLQLAMVYFVPTGIPPHKSVRNITAIEHRLCMAELATAEADYFLVSRIDADRPGPHYTVDLLQQLHEQCGATAELYFLMGLDSLRDLPSWRNPEWLVQHCRLVALNRHAVALDWQRLEAQLPGVQERVSVLDMPELEIASSDLRERVRNGQPIRYQVPRAVEAYIQKQGLYR